MLMMIHANTGNAINLANLSRDGTVLRGLFVDYVRTGWRPVGERSRAVAAAVLFADYARALAA